MELMFNNQEEIDYLYSFLKPDMDVLEWGSGGSTIEIGKRVKSLVSIEHDIEWFEKVKFALAGETNHPVQKISFLVPRNNSVLIGFNSANTEINVVFRNKEEAPGDDGTYEDYKDYVEFPKSLNKKFDVIFIDGRARVECAKVAVELLKPSGVILIHDMLHPNPVYHRKEYDVVMEFLDSIGGEFTLYAFKPKEGAIQNLNKPIQNMSSNDTKNMCWYRDDCVDAMNLFYDKEIKGFDLSKHGHLKMFSELLNLVDEKGEKLLDLGTGTAMISEFCKDFDFVGSDLPHIIAGCAMRNYPNHFYRPCDIIYDDLAWISEFKTVVANGLIDIMPDALSVLEKILTHASKYVIIHRQEITEQGETRQIVNGSYSGETYHSIINRKEFMELLDRMNFDVIKELPLVFSNWENNGSSFLIRKRKSWALDDIDRRLYTKYFLGKRDGVFIEAGANDGLTQSNTMFFEFYKNWSGILVEPMPDLMDKCRQNRSKGNCFVRAALVSNEHGKNIEMIYTPECNGLLSVVNNKNANEHLKKIMEQKREFITVPTYSLNDILESLYIGTGKIDLLSLDLEGYEPQALRGLDIDKWLIEYILVEQLGEESEVPTLLSSHYDFVERMSEKDYLYKRKN